MLLIISVDDQRKALESYLQERYHGVNVHLKREDFNVIAVELDVNYDANKELVDDLADYVGRFVHK